MNVKWEQHKLENVFTKYQKRINPTQQNLELWSLTIDQGLVAKTKRYDRSFLVRKNDIFNLVPKGYFVYNPMNITLGTIDVNKYHSIAVSGYYIVLKSNDQFNVAFLASLLHTSSMINKYKRFSTGSLLEKQRLQFPNFAKVKIISPRLSEQTKIGLLMNQVNNLIDLQQRKLEQLKQLKTAMLQQLFVNKNYKQPILRFKNFNGNWEKRKFSELATIRRGLTYKPKDVRECGKNSKRVLRSSNINENSFVIYNDDVFVDKSSINIAYVHNNDILITAANGSSKLVGKHALIHDIPDNSAVHGGFMLLASSNNPEFINALMSSPWYSRFVNNYVIGGNGAIGNLKKDDLDSQIIYTPIKNEIKKIGHFFNRLDNLIALQQNKLTQLTTLKKYLLQKLFI
ncbi:restriction endonuclease subunit S [Limosilactobacillus reuteri]|uniref:restriction endonuclease subunit S n=1 Tax=Limosilactobacillus reuteri TaxID=1598 RepID=UPI00386CF7A8